MPDPYHWEEYHFFAEEFKSLQSPQSLRACLNVTVHDMCLAAHLHRLQSYHIEDWTVRREQCIQRKPKVFLLKLIRKVRTVKAEEWSLVCGTAWAILESRLTFDSELQETDRLWEGHCVMAWLDRPYLRVRVAHYLSTMKFVRYRRPRGFARAQRLSVQFLALDVQNVNQSQASEVA